MVGGLWEGKEWNDCGCFDGCDLVYMSLAYSALKLVVSRDCLAWGYGVLDGGYTRRGIACWLEIPVAFPSDDMVMERMLDDAHCVLSR